MGKGKNYFRKGIVRDCEALYNLFFCKMNDIANS